MSIDHYSAFEKEVFKRRRRRRYGPPVGRTRSPSPWCLPAPTNLDRRSMRGTLTADPIGFNIMAVALLFVSSPWTPDPRNTLTKCSGYHSRALEGGRGKKSSCIAGLVATPLRGWGHSHTGVSP